VGREERESGGGGRMKHTAGPWRIDDYDRTMIWATDAHMRICDIRGWGHLTGACSLNLPDAEAEAIQEANARLIAAAPELLAACKAQHEAIDMLFAMLISVDKTFFPSKSGPPWDALVQANAAIAKAEGSDG
jgi:hypothetical protein